MILQLSVQGFKIRKLADARRAPGGPEVHDGGAACGRRRREPLRLALEPAALKSGAFCPTSSPTWAHAGITGRAASTIRAFRKRRRVKTAL